MVFYPNMRSGVVSTSGTRLLKQEKSHVRLVESRLSPGKPFAIHLGSYRRFSAQRRTTHPLLGRPFVTLDEYQAFALGCR